MISPVLIRKTLRDVRTSMVAVACANFLMALLDVAIYPQYRDQLKDFQVPDYFKSFVGEAGDWTSPAGFLSTEFFSWIPLLLITVAIIGATGTLAGEEGNGTLDLLLAQPVTRTRLVLEKAAGLVLAVTIAALASIPGFLLGMTFADMDISAWRLVLATLNMLPLTLIFLTVSLWSSAALPSRGAAAAVAIGAVVVTYFVNMLGAAVDLMETPRKVSPFYWSDASRILLHGFRDWGRLAGMLGVSAAFLALALSSFNRRDVAGGVRECRMSWPRLHRW